jgi:arabinan endo-1,5-alpha-L-arabinosidase
VGSVSAVWRVRLADLDRYEIRVGRSTSVNGPFWDKDGKNLTDGGGTVVYASNHGVVYAPGGIGVLPANEKHPEILYYHYCESIPCFVCVVLTRQ